MSNELSYLKETLPKHMSDGIEKLTEKELMYFQVMWAKYGVLFITSKPGVAKSAIGKSIAKKMGFKYIDMRLSMSDEGDFKYPYLEDVLDDSGNKTKVSGYAVPEWAYKSNSQPTIIHFEELNRAPLFVRNAALQILLEREIGDFKFNDNVIMMASGNLGGDGADGDGADVEELDSALNNRLVHIPHNITNKEWIDNYAQFDCHETIVNYIKSHPEKIYQRPSDEVKAYATNRSWTMLSKFITENYGMDSKPKTFLPMVKKVGNGYIGSSVMGYIRYCEDLINISIVDVLNRYDSIAKDLESYNQSRNSELLESLKSYTYQDLSSKQVNNSIKFLRNLNDEQIVSYLLYIIDSNDDIRNNNIRKLIKSFPELLTSIEEKTNV